jgi:uncharacterized protein (TIGR03435 family)
MFIVGWIAGAVVFLLPVIAGLWQIRTLRRSALPWCDGQSIVDTLALESGISRRVPLLVHEHLPGPMTCGVVNPAIVLPADAPGWPADNLRRAVVHELEHVRRGDWASQCLARIVCACYWLHPLVWVASRRLSLEAERACDDAVLRRADATAYADQLVGLAERLSAAHNTPLLAMANRRDLATRVLAVLDSRQHRGRAGSRVVALACATSTVIVILVSPLWMVAAPQQAAMKDVPDGTGQRFEVASIRRCENEPPTPPGQRSSQGGFPNASPGRFVIECGTVERLISTAYVQNGEMLTNQAARIGDVQWLKNVPSWVRSEKYTIEAKTDAATDRKVMLGPMLRALLEERFKLKVHRDTEEAPMYVMTVAKGGLKIAPIGPDGCTAFDRDNPPSREEMRALVDSPKPVCGNMNMMRGDGGTGKGTTMRWTIGGTTIQNFAGTLSAFMDHHVIDNTGIAADKFNVRLEFALDEHVPGPDKRYGPPTEFPESSGPNIFQALEQQLGLKLTPTKGQHGFIVIDQVERPSVNGAALFVPAQSRGGR